MVYVAGAGAPRMFRMENKEAAQTQKMLCIGFESFLSYQSVDGAEEKEVWV